MDAIDDLNIYSEEIGGVFYFREFNAIPFNHWKNDCDWMVCILDGPISAAFVPVTAASAREACALAIDKYTYNHKEDDNDI